LIINYHLVLYSNTSIKITYNNIFTGIVCGIFVSSYIKLKYSLRPSILDMKILSETLASGKSIFSRDIFLVLLTNPCVIYFIISNNNCDDPCIYCLQCIHSYNYISHNRPTNDFAEQHPLPDKTAIKSSSSFCSIT
jgi:hypothetical protein